MAFLVAPAAASAADSYVNDATGNDGNDCSAATGPGGGGGAVGPCKTIGAAIPIAGTGETIHVAPGTYNEFLVLGSGKSLIASGSVATTIIDGSPSTAVETLTGDGAGTIQGFTIRSPANGVNLSAPATVKGNTLDSTGAGSQAVTVDTGADGSIIDTNIISGSNSNIRTGIKLLTNATVKDNTLSNLTVPIQFLGGMTSIVSGNEISGTNHLSGFPAAIDIVGGSNNVAATVTDNYIHAPFAPLVAGIQITTCCGFTADATLKRNRIFNHYQGVYVDGGLPISLEGDVISSTEANSVGLVLQGAGATVTNATFWENQLYDIYSSGQQTTVDATILDKDVDGSGTCTITNSRGPTANSICSGQTYDSVVFPDFVDASTDDFRLNSTSTMIDAGGASTTTTDIDGTQRNKDGACPDGAARDIGAFEFVPTMPLRCIPVVSSVTPASPGNTNNPLVKGTTSPGETTVKLYSDFDCGTEIGSGSASDFATTGIAATVPDNSFTDIYAASTDGVNGYTDCSSTHLEYEEDSAPPGTSITSKPRKTIKTRRSHVTVRFRFTGAGAGGHYRCKIDSHSYAGCSSPKSYRLRRGSHTFRVYATDAAGNVDTSPASYHFRIKKR